MHGPRIVGRRRTWSIADLLDIRRPHDRESLRPPHRLEQTTIRSERSAIHRARRIGKPHLRRIDRWALRLFSRRIAKTSPGRAHVPEVAAHEISLTLIVVQHRSKRRIGVSLRLALAETGPDGSGVRSGGPIELRDWSGEPCFRRVAECAGLVTIDRELLVEKHQFAEQLDLLDLIVGDRREALQSIRFDPVYFALYASNLGKHCRRKWHRTILRKHNGGRCGHSGNNGNANPEPASDPQLRERVRDHSRVLPINVRSMGRQIAKAEISIDVIWQGDCVCKWPSHASAVSEERSTLHRCRT